MKRILVIAMAMFMVSIAPTFSLADGKVTLAWDANIESDLAGYKLYYKEGAINIAGGPPYDGTVLNQGPSPISIPVTQLSDPGHPVFEVTFPEGTQKKIYFALSAYDTEIPPKESSFSNEVYIYWPKDVEDGVQPLIPRAPAIKSIERVLEVTMIEKTIDKVIYGDSPRYAKNYFPN
jgi:hypothetical protein